MALRHKIFVALTSLLLSGCIKYGAPELEQFSLGEGVFVSSEGNFMYGNASLAFYDTTTHKVIDNLFYRANGARLGDVAQSVTLYGGECWVVVNNSGVIYSLDAHTGVVRNIVRGLVSPRYIHFTSPTKAYVTDLYASKIYILNPQSHKIEGEIPTLGHASTESMVEANGRLFVTCWSFDNTVLVIDTASDKIISSIQVGAQPKSIVTDADGQVWVLCTGSLQADASSPETLPQLCRINPETLAIERRFLFDEGASPMRLTTDPERRFLYFLEGDVLRMSIYDQTLPSHPFLPSQGTIYYGLGVDCTTGEVYLADAIDYVQPGVVERYSPSGELIDKFTTGICPAAFAFQSIP